MDENKYISVGEYAEFIGKTPQQIYNLLHSGEVVGIEFNRGKMRGWLVQKPNGFDVWKQQKKVEQ